MAADPRQRSSEALAEKLSERHARRIVNQLAQRLASRHYHATRAKLRAQLDAAEAHGTDDALLDAWQAEIRTDLHEHADICT